jgi:hypothetical protein
MADKGAPTKYKPEYAEQARKLCLLGYTDVQLAEFYGVCEATIYNWKKEHPDFLESMNKGKAIADSEVAASLYERATGYSHPDTHISNYQGEVTKTDIVKHYPPDTAAAFIWLKNRAGWKDRKELDVKAKHNYSEMTDEELDAEIAALESEDKD